MEILERHKHIPENFLKFLSYGEVVGRQTEIEEQIEIVVLFHFVKSRKPLGKVA